MKSPKKEPLFIGTKLATSLGFKGSGMWDDSSYYWTYYKKDPINCRIIGISQYCPGYIFSFQLTKKEYSEFEKSKLSLVPPGCCNASGGKHIDNDRCKIHYEGDIRDKKHLQAILDKIDVYYSFDTL